ATNTGNVPQNITVSDTPALDGFTCTPTNGSSIAPQGTITCTGTHTVTSADLTAGHFDDNACADAPGATEACAPDSVSGAPTIVSQITPTMTTCSQFAAGTSPTLSQIQYSLKGSGSKATINQVNPGVLFYWVKVSGSNSYTITQTLSADTLTTTFGLASGSFAYNANCQTVNATVTQNADGSVTVSGSGIVYIGIKYNPGTVVGKPAPNPATVTYTFATTGVPGSTSSVNLVKK
ncbi:MAG TPA: hypothetical protein VJ838_05305, partial [Gaiellaceae bacterium]|nr:hypothetical protein [Gaiellaceae bacterium]